MKRLLAMLLLPALLAGCTVGPDYRPPELAVPAEWGAPADPGQPLRAEDWWKLFDDPVLNDLITAALAGNRDLMIAAARIQEARASLTVARAAQLPTLDAQGAANQGKDSETAKNPLPTTRGPAAEDYLLKTSAAFELDLWGKYRRASEAARANLLASQYGRETTRLSLLAEVANTYFSLRGLDLQLGIAQRTLRARREQLELQKKRFAYGIVSELDMRQAEVDYQGAAVTIPPLERQIAAQESALSLLLGRYPGEIKRGLGMDQFTVPPRVPAGLPSELLNRRPDVLAAEQKLIAANANLGVAKAAFFPTISLTGYLGFQSVQLDSLFNTPSSIWQYNLGTTLPIFNAGRLEAQVEVAQAQREAALQTYLKTAETSFKEVADALTHTRTSQAEHAAQEARVKALTRSLRLANLRYQNGHAAYLEVLDAQRNLFTAELAQVQARQSQLSAVVTLYKALGGGWEPSFQGNLP